MVKKKDTDKLREFVSELEEELKKAELVLLEAKEVLKNEGRTKTEARQPILGV